MNMKKTIAKLVAVAGLTISMTAFAADDAGTAVPANGAIALADCSLLSEAVVINLSANVIGAYACNTTDNVIAVATCHPTGTKDTEREVACDLSADPAIAGCADDGEGNGVMTIDGAAAFTASSAGGRVSEVGAANCVIGGDTTAEAETAAGL